MSQSTLQQAATRPLSTDEHRLIEAFQRAASWQRAELVDMAEAFIDALNAFATESAPTHYRVETEIEPDRVLVKVVPRHMRTRRRPSAR